MTADEDYRLRTLWLEGIERHAQWLQTSSQSLADYVQRLAKRPPYETRAQDEMNKALQITQDTVAILNQSIQNYTAKIVAEK